jgi:hypothetical protein
MDFENSFWSYALDEVEYWFLQGQVSMYSYKVFVGQYANGINKVGYEERFSTAGKNNTECQTSSLQAPHERINPDFGYLPAGFLWSRKSGRVADAVGAVQIANIGDSKMQPSVIVTVPMCKLGARYSKLGADRSPVDYHYFTVP